MEKRVALKIPSELKNLMLGFSAFILSLTPWQISKVIFTLQFFIFSLLQIPIVIGKSVNFLLKKFTPKGKKTSSVMDRVVLG